MRSLTQSQRDVATLTRDKTENDIQAEANQDNLVLDYSGVKAGALTAQQKAQLLELVGLYVNKYATKKGSRPYDRGSGSPGQHIFRLV